MLGWLDERLVDDGEVDHVRILDGELAGRILVDHHALRVIEAELDGSEVRKLVDLSAGMLGGESGLGTDVGLEGEAEGGIGEADAFVRLGGGSLVGLFLAGGRDGEGLDEDVRLIEQGGGIGEGSPLDDGGYVWHGIRGGVSNVK